MVNFVRIGKHYVNLDNISYIERIEQTIDDVGIRICYKFGFSVYTHIVISEEEFNEFKDRCLKMWERSGGICHFFD